MKKITPKKVPFEKYREFVEKVRKETHAKGKWPPADDSWFVENRYGWGLSDESKKRFEKLKDDPDPIFLEIEGIGKYDAYEPYAIVSDKAKYAITVAHQHIKNVMKKIYPNIELDIPDYDPDSDKPWPLKQKK